MTSELSIARGLCRNSRSAAGSSLLQAAASHAGHFTMLSFCVLQVDPFWPVYPPQSVLHDFWAIPLLTWLACACAGPVTSEACRAEVLQCDLHTCAGLHNQQPYPHRQDRVRRARSENSPIAARPVYQGAQISTPLLTTWQ